MRRPYTPPALEPTPRALSSFVLQDGRWAAHLLDANVTADEWRQIGLSGISVQMYLEMHALRAQITPGAVDEQNLWRLAELRGDAPAEAYYFSCFTPEQQQEWLFPWDVIINDEAPAEPEGTAAKPSIEPETEWEREARLETEHEYGSFEQEVAAARQAQAHLWLQDNQPAIDQYNQRITRDGTSPDQMDAYESNGNARGR
jgi:hypothetical protein